MKISQAQQANALVAAIRVLDGRAIEIQRTVDTDDLDSRPREGGWSASQVFEHLCVANDTYLGALRPLVERTAAGAERSDARWRPSLMGRLLARSMESTRKFPAPKQWAPAPTPRANVVAEFLERQHEIVRLIERSNASPWERMRMASPVASFIRMNIGDAFTILVRHEERHFKQIDRVLRAIPVPHVPDRRAAPR